MSVPPEYPLVPPSAPSTAGLQALQDMLIAHRLGPSIAGIDNMVARTHARTHARTSTHARTVRRQVARARYLVQLWLDWKDHYQANGYSLSHLSLCTHATNAHRIGLVFSSL